MQDMMNPERIRPLIFLSSLILFHLLQLWSPIFNNNLKGNNLKGRIKSNWLLFIASIITLRVFIPSGIAGIILLTQKYDVTLFEIYKLPYWLDLVITIIIFDFLIYWQHRFFHLFDPLWRLHKVHHCDVQMDVSTGFRFHPIEILVSAGYKILFLIVFSPRVETFIFYEVILNTMAMFNHSNLKLPKKLDQFLRFFIVTPAMHFPHHDTSSRLMNLNFGNTLSLWDRLFRTYTTDMVNKFGTQDVCDEKSKKFMHLIFMPFKSKV